MGRRAGAVTTIHRGSDGTLWIGAELGLWRVDDDRLIPAHTVGSSDSTILANAIVRSLVSDAAGNLWIGTSTNGLFPLHIQSGELAHFVHDPADSTSISYSAVIELIRGNGHDLAEFDLLLVDTDNHVAFAEVVTSPADLKEFEQEIAYKKKLLGYLYNQKITPFLLVSSFDLSNYSVVKRLAKDRTNAFIHTSSCEEIKSIVKHYRPRILYNKPENHKKLIRATDIPVKNSFDYKRYHDEVRNHIFSDISKNDTKKGIRKFPEIPDQTGQLVKKVLYGAMYPQAIKSLCDTYGLTVIGKKLDFEDFFKIYSKAVIATDLPVAARRRRDSRVTPSPRPTVAGNAPCPGRRSRLSASPPRSAWR